jgi:hypothetical protein
MPDRPAPDGRAADAPVEPRADASTSVDGRSPRRRRRAIAVGVAFVLVAGVVAFVARRHAEAPGSAIGAVAGVLVDRQPRPRTLDAYRGLGAWMDAYDYAAAYQAGGRAAPLGANAVDDMARHGVRTLFVQAAREDSRADGALVDPALLGDLLVRAHRAGLRVVAWYLPRFGDVDADLAHIKAMSGFRALGHRFDGIAVDIELTDDVPDTATRNSRLISLSEQVRTEMGNDTVGAIVLPPVQTEVVNPQLWPAFPWRDLAPLYDTWLPMSYWTFRKASSGYHDGYTYNEESTRRLRRDLGDPEAPVHAIGGIADEVTPAELDDFARSLVDTNAIGGSVYDWATLTPADRAELQAKFASGALAALANR